MPVALLFSGPAMSQTRQQLECGVQSAPAGVGAELVDDLLREQGMLDGEVSTPNIELIKAVNNCVDEIGLDLGQNRNYFGYVLSRIYQFEIEKRLGDVHVRITAVESALGVEPGQTPPHPDEWTEEQDRLVSLEISKAVAEGFDREVIFAYLGSWIGMKREADKYLAALENR